MGICKSKSKNCPCNRCQKGWWSRRHPTRDAQDEAREQYQDGKRGPNVRKGRKRRK